MNFHIKHGLGTNIILLLMCISGTAWLYGVAVTGYVVNPYSPAFFTYAFPGNYTSDPAYISNLSTVSSSTSLYGNTSTFGGGTGIITPYFQTALVTVLALMVAGIVVLSISSIVFGTTFPNPYLLFAPVAVILLNLFITPASLFDQLQMWQPIKMFIIAMLQVLYIIAIIAWFRGGDTF